MTHKEAREYFNYDPDTGGLTWKKSPGGGTKSGENTGRTLVKGYRHLRFRGVRYAEHRVIWLLLNGYFPEHEVDHINRNREDNRLVNLREVTRACNSKNIGIKNSNTSGVTGVYYSNQRGKWVAQIRTEGKQYNLGRFLSLTSAVKARHEAEVRHKWPGCNDSTPAYQYLVAEGML